MKKLLLISSLLVGLNLLSPNVTLASGGVPAGVTLQGWVVGTTATNVTTQKSFSGISFVYSGGFSTDIALNVPVDPSWHKLDDIRPILEAFKEGYGSNLGGTGGIVGTTINFAPNVLAAMKVQNFNPAQVGGANIPPSSTILNTDQTNWLKQPGIGYASDLANITSATQLTTATQTQVVTPTPSVSQKQTQSQPQVQPQTQTQQTSSTNQTSSTTSTPVQSKSTTQAQVESNPPVGEEVKTPSGQITQQMVVADQQLSKQNPPSLNPASIPSKIPTAPINKKKFNLLGKWTWIAAAGALIILAVAARIVYIKKRHV
jgi:hypothetical protein